MSIPYTWVYLIHDPYTDLYKIGQSDDPKARLRDLNKQPGTILPTPNDFVIYEAWYCPAAKEREYHKEYAHYRQRGEWFALTPAVINEIECDLYECKRWNSHGQCSQLLEEIAKDLTELMSSHRYYTSGIAAFLQFGMRTGVEWPCKQLTTSLPNGGYFYRALEVEGLVSGNTING